MLPVTPEEVRALLKAHPGFALAVAHNAMVKETREILRESGAVVVEYVYGNYTALVRPIGWRKQL